MSSAPKIAVIYWSLYNHVAQLAEEVAKGARATGASVEIFQLKETFSEEGLAQMHASAKLDHPIFDSSNLVDYDGFLFGIPTRYGRTPAQWAAFFDSTGPLWMKQALAGKFAGIFTSTGTQHGGQETTALTTIPWLVHHGIIYVPMGYSPKELFELEEVVGGSAYGAAAIVGGRGGRQVTTKELSMAHYQGKDFATKLGRYVKGNEAPI